MDEITPPWPEDDPRDRRVSSRRAPTTPVEDLFVVKALTARLVELEEIIRRLTYRDGDGVIHVTVPAYSRLDTIVPDHMYRMLDRIHPPLADEEG